MSGRIHDLITAENFAKWAEGRDVIPDPIGDLNSMVGVSTYVTSCAIAQYLSGIGFTKAGCTAVGYGVAGNANEHVAPGWMKAVAVAFDSGCRSGPALAQIARENA